MSIKCLTDFFPAKNDDNLFSQRRRWSVHDDSVLVFEYRCKPSPDRPCEKLALFDLDETLITTKGQHVFSKHSDDWQFLNSNTASRMARLEASGYLIVVLTNQNRLARGYTAEMNRKFRAPSRLKNKPTQLDHFRGKVQKIAQALGVNLWVLAAVKKDFYRKPRPGMFVFTVEHIVKGCKAPTGLGALLDSLVAIRENPQFNLEHSFYVGDAAGRSGGPSRPRDHSSCDLQLAKNSSLLFYTPEAFEHIVSAFPTDKALLFDSKSLSMVPPELSSATWFHHEEHEAPSEHKDWDEALLHLDAERCLFVLVGAPGSGKSTFARHLADKQGLTLVTVPTQASAGTAIAAASVGKSLSKNSLLVVDAPHPRAADRVGPIQLARELGMKALCLFFDRSLYFCCHNMAFGEYALQLYEPPFNAKAVTRSESTKAGSFIRGGANGNSNEAVYHWFHQFEAPTVAEGFEQVISIPFYKIWPSYGNSGKKLELLWGLHLL